MTSPTARPLRTLAAALPLLVACADPHPTAPGAAPRLSASVTTSTDVLVTLDLGTLVPGGWSAASDVNNKGQAVGCAGGVTGEYLPVLYQPGSQTSSVVQLPLPPNASGGCASGINEVGQISGIAWWQNEDRAVVWDTRKTPASITVLGRGPRWEPGDPQASQSVGRDVANAINNSGVVVGVTHLYDNQGNGTYTAVAWQLGAGGAEPVAHVLATPAGTHPTFSLANDVNDAGEIAGVAHGDAAWPGGAVVWQWGTPVTVARDLGYGEANGISSDGRVVGTNAKVEAVLWVGSTPTLLGWLRDEGQPRGVNRNGQVVATNGSTRTAFLWQDGVRTNLSPLAGFTYVSAGRVNDAGQIAGFSESTTSSRRATLWTTAAPTPAQQLADLLAELQALAASGALPRNQAEALAAKLHAASRLIEQQNTVAATGQLQAFINQIQGLVQAGKLSASEGDALVRTASAAIQQIQSGA